jgi:hypothetical protein
MMFPELNDLLAARGAIASAEDYRQAVVSDNVLGKRTMTARRNTFQLLAELYALDPEVTLFRLLRHFWELDRNGRPLLALLCAAARDPLLRLSAATVLRVSPGEPFPPELLVRMLDEERPDRYSGVVQRAVASRLTSSWGQAGHLSGTRIRHRSRPVVTPGNAAYALSLGHLQGARGRLLLTTSWARMLDVDETELARLAAEASRREWLTYRQAGGVVEIRFPGLFTKAEEELLRGQD